MRARPAVRHGRYSAQAPQVVVILSVSPHGAAQMLAAGRASPSDSMRGSAAARSILLKPRVRALARMRTECDLCRGHARSRGAGDPLRILRLLSASQVTEAFINVTVESMASGLVIVAYNYAAAAEHIEDGMTGVLARYDDSQH